MLTLRKHTPFKSPLIVSCPHAGTEIPSDIVKSLLIVDSIELKRDPDLFVDELYQAADSLGACFISSSISRYVIDLNRDPDVHDASFVIGGEQTSNPKFLGLVAHRNTLGHPLLKTPLTSEQLQNRISLYYTPFHNELRTMIDTCVKQFGYCIHIDAHSMPSKAATGHEDSGDRADIVPGDLDGTSCSPQLTDFVSEFFSSRNFAVKRNHPYKGGFITEHFGRPDQNVHTLQIEINRKLYMNETTREKLPEKFNALQNEISNLIRELTLLELV